MHPIYDKLGPTPVLSNCADLDRFLFLFESATSGACDLSEQDVRAELLRLLPAAKISVKCLATFDRVSDANERVELTLRRTCGLRLGDIKKALDIALGTAVNAAPHELMPDDWCEQQLRSVAGILERVAIAVTELHAWVLTGQSTPSTQSTKSTNGDAVSRESGGQPAAGNGKPPEGHRTNVVAEGRPDIDDIPY